MFVYSSICIVVKQLNFSICGIDCKCICGLRISCFNMIAVDSGRCSCLPRSYFVCYSLQLNSAVHIISLQQLIILQKQIDHRVISSYPTLIVHGRCLDRPCVILVRFPLVLSPDYLSIFSSVDYFDGQLDLDYCALLSITCYR